MASQLKPFPITEFKTGISTYLQPWIRPQDAFEPLINAYIYRGTINKRNGSLIFGDRLALRLTITNITKAATAVVTAVNNFSTPDFGVATVVFSAVVGMVEINGLTGTVISATPTTFTVNINSTGFSAYVSGGIAIGFSTLGAPVMGLMRYINQTTGAVILLAATTQTLYQFNPGPQTFTLVGTPPTYTGNITQFFNYDNWQPSETSPSLIYMTNDKDNITTFDGTNAASFAPVVDLIGTTITAALDVKVFKNRLLIIRPVYSAGTIPTNQAIAWSALNNPDQATGFLNFPDGGGGFLTIPTGDTILATEFLRDILVVFATNSTWIFRYTGVDVQPFRFDKVNDSKSTNAPYGSVAYDQRCTSIGSTGLIACDGVNVQRYDIPIIDYYETQIFEQYYSQIFSQRYDNLNQAWMLYVSNGSTNPLVGGVAPGSDQALVYNFLENTWATYSFAVPLTCLGTFYAVEGKTWAQLTQSWETANLPWKSYSSQKLAPILLSGDTAGNVYWMDNDNSVTDFGSTPTDGSTIFPDITTTRWNPFISTGQKTEFGYIDIYYSVASYNPNNPVQLILSFYVDNSQQVALQKTLTLDGPYYAAMQNISVGTGGTVYSGTITVSSYIVGGALEITVTTNDGVESFSEDGTGILSGTLGDSGKINYVTGVWNLDILSGVPVGNIFVANFSVGGNNFNFKRIYCNLTGQFVQMNIDPTEDADFQILGFILWAREAGRLTQ